MDNKFYIKRNENNQISKVNEINIKYLDNNFNLVINEQNLINLLRKIEEVDLGDYFSNSKFGKLPLSAELIQKFTLCTLYVVKSLGKEEFNQLPVEKKFEFIISQKTIAWINLLDKNEIVGFLKFCNIHSEVSSTIIELRNLAKTALKNCRNNQDLDEDQDETELTFIESNSSINLNNSGDEKELKLKESNSLLNLNNSRDQSASVTFIENNNLIIKNIEPDSADTLNIENKIKSLPNELQITNTKNDLFDTSTLNNKKHNIKMNTIHKPDIFSGKSHEDIDKFIKKFELVSIVNNWENNDKLILIQLYLKDSAESFFEHLKLKKENITWDEVKTELITEFTTVGNKHLLRAKLDNLKLEKGETYKEFIIKVIDLGNKINKNMTEEEICEYILKGLPIETFQQIILADNTSINNIKKTLEKLEVARFLKRSDDKVHEEVEKLTREMNILKTHISQISEEQRHQNLPNNTNNDYQNRKRNFNNNANFSRSYNYENNNYRPGNNGNTYQRLINYRDRNDRNTVNYNNGYFNSRNHNNINNQNHNNYQYPNYNRNQNFNQFRNNNQYQNHNQNQNDNLNPNRYHNRNNNQTSSNQLQNVDQLQNHNNNNNQNPQTMFRPDTQKKCFNCGSVTHFKNNCPMLVSKN